jgi:hypothetical protein
MDFNDLFEIEYEDDFIIQISFIQFFKDKNEFNKIINILKKYKSIFETETKTWKILKIYKVNIEYELNNISQNYNNGYNEKHNDIIDIISDYINKLENDSRRLENLNNIIKFARTSAIKLQQESIK